MFDLAYLYQERAYPIQASNGLIYHGMRGS